MSDFFNFIVQNFVLICIVLILGLILTKKLKTHRKTSIYLLIILFLTLMISIIDAIKIHAANDAHNVLAVTFMASVLYFIRPLCIVCFIFLSGQKFKGVSFYILLCPLIILFVTNLFPFFPATKTLSYSLATTCAFRQAEEMPEESEKCTIASYFFNTFSKNSL